MARDDHPSADPGEPDAQTRILRRAPLSPEPEPATGIIRRHPTGEIPVPAADERSREEHRTDERSREEHRTDEPATTLVPPVTVEPPSPAHPWAAITTTVVSILSGWATAVIATDLITGWWGTDPLFCVAMGFLTAISSAANITGLIMMLLRQRTGRLLVIVGAVVALLMFTGLFVAGADLPGAVYALPLLPVATVGLAALPQTGRWARN
ncbi:hypothetical protein ACAG25_18630 [Mycobacterium sp. pV006]|uniref:hypothetical protein n=1 Tax=Mycobacterium sp. pV006 TaxID=3238983 RepID=UPI00351B1F81